jgi:hypothetical protein
MNITNAENPMKNKQNRLWFRDLWETNSNEYDFFELAISIDKTLTWEEFDKGWQYRTVLNFNFNIAVEEFIQILHRTF